MINVRSKSQAPELIKSDAEGYGQRDHRTSRLGNAYTETEPPSLQNAELSAANLLSSGGIDLAKCSLKIS